MLVGEVLVGDALVGNALDEDALVAGALVAEVLLGDVLVGDVLTGRVSSAVLPAFEELLVGRMVESKSSGATGISQEFWKLSWRLFWTRPP
jgi:hypothetical protein